ncbi:uncharacterized protein K460DRAFT_381670 [Cucurbitaria berberidis CBS 394.84]|uniref:Uncharacterized protein n=1 Tax=Cucurbitaria berberidis CBS 394.84 TaxID=1168544 RepID=A0A9P4LD30_9PLEO|nr:uncharacterized protein K460DRAFT_381670 [Cucurbitaria berberidis CBS 394.84]KAF1849739.1 hypothetical protein K460DRAFT_381670 [Cucurbitaria berberidis CBS 394.84]
MARATSLALSDISELTVLSRSPSPVPDYATVFTSANEIAESVNSVQSTQRGDDGRFISPSKKRAHFTAEESLRTTRKGEEADTPASTLDPMSPMPWVVGEGGFGTMSTLPKEIRQEIYGYAFDIDCPVTIKQCCGPDTTKRERQTCRKHGIATKMGAGRFNILQVSKAIREEASWVVFEQGSLHLEVARAVAPYLNGYRSQSLRHMPIFVQHNARKTAMWTAAAQFRLIEISVPENELNFGNPLVYTDHLLGIVALLCKTWEHRLLVPSAATAKSVHVNLGSVFHQMLPFNMESQAAEGYGDLLDWLFVHSPCAEPDFDKLALKTAHDLRRLVFFVGKHDGNAKWKFTAKTQLKEKDKGGARELRAFQFGCANSGVMFEHMDCS